MATSKALIKQIKPTTMKEELYKVVWCSDRLPKESGEYITNLGLLICLPNEEDIWGRFYPAYWLEPVEPIDKMSAEEWYTKQDLEDAFMAGTNKSNWIKAPLNGVVSGESFVLVPIFEEWYKKFKNQQP